MDNKKLKELNYHELIKIYQEIKEFIEYLNKEKDSLDMGDVDAK